MYPQRQVGSKVQIDRLHPMWSRSTKRLNKNWSYWKNGNSYMLPNKPTKGALQNPNQVGSGIGRGLTASDLGTILSSIKKGVQLVDKAYTSEIGTQVKNTWGAMVNDNPKWRPGFSGERHLLTNRGVTYNFCGQNLGCCLCSKA